MSKSVCHHELSYLVNTVVRKRGAGCLYLRISSDRPTAVEADGPTPAPLRRAQTC